MLAIAQRHGCTVKDEQAPEVLTLHNRARVLMIEWQLAGLNAPSGSMPRN
ncbi:MAG TPA: hypothetical protein VGJ20_41925 [Xanthobacteraceae bacterium]|jgi:hypothetical protein